VVIHLAFLLHVLEVPGFKHTNFLETRYSDKLSFHNVFSVKLNSEVCKCLTVVWVRKVGTICWSFLHLHLLQICYVHKSNVTKPCDIGGVAVVRFGCDMFPVRGSQIDVAHNFVADNTGYCRVW